MATPIRRTAHLLITVLLVACASGPQFPTEGIDPALTPRQAVAEMESLQGDRVLWGGAVIAVRNLQDATQFEILGYPLGSDQKPNLGADPLGRFLVSQRGYVEAVDYPRGSLVTVSGRLLERRQGQVGEAPYTYPVVQADRVYRWPPETQSPASRVHFGIGVGVIFND